jgi:sugar lactone lactonase YvrE
MLRSALALGLVLAAVAAPCAAASSIVYVKGGDVWRAAPNGSRKRVVVRAPGVTFFSAVTQDDRGRIWAVRERARRWERYSAAGRRLGKPFNTAGTGLTLHYDPARNLPGFAGPADAQISDDGRLLASWGILEQLDHIDPFAIPPAPKYFVQGFVAPNVTLSNRDADISSKLPLNDLAWPSWLHDGTFIAAAFSNLLKGYGVWYVPANVPELRYWFGPRNNGLRIANLEVTRRGDYVAVTTDTHNALSKDEEITVGHLPGPPPAIPDRDCTWPNPHGTVAGLTWSPDGTTLAWSDSVGVWTARFAVPAQTGQVCVVTAKRLLARKATSPDWGPSGG